LAAFACSASYCNRRFRSSSAVEYGASVLSSFKHLWITRLHRGELLDIGNNRKNHDLGVQWG